MTVPEAAERLGTSERAVTQLASSGALAAVKRGSVWWIDADAVARRAREARSAGRPLSPAVAWAVILLASDDDRWRALGQHGHQPRRAREWLRAHQLSEDAFRLVGRARREAFDAHPSELSRVASRPDVMRTGISAATEIGLHGGRGEVELYASEVQRELITIEHGLQARRGSTLMRWVPADIWPRIKGDVAPRIAVLCGSARTRRPAGATRGTGSAGRRVIEIAPPDEASRRLWHAVGDLAELLPRDWTLVGGLMVQLHALEHNVPDVRVTVDIDVLGQARPPGPLQAIDRALIDAGFDAHPPDPDNYGYRYERDGLIVDVLAPDGIRPPPTLDGSRHAVGIPGGSQALARSETVTSGSTDGRSSCDDRAWRARSSSRRGRCSSTRIQTRSDRTCSDCSRSSPTRE